MIPFSLPRTLTSFMCSCRMSDAQAIREEPAVASPALGHAECSFALLRMAEIYVTAVGCVHVAHRWRPSALLSSRAPSTRRPPTIPPSSSSFSCSSYIPLFLFNAHVRPFRLHSPGLVLSQPPPDWLLR